MNEVDVFECLIIKGPGRTEPKKCRQFMEAKVISKTSIQSGQSLR
jgi:hypothetical protein